MSSASSKSQEHLHSLQLTNNSNYPHVQQHQQRPPSPQRTQPNRPPPPPPDLHRKVNSDYIRISECHTGVPERFPRFSSTLKHPSSAHYIHSSHQKSRSLTDNIGPSYISLDLNLPDLATSKNSKNPTPPTTVYKEVDFLKTDALNQCKVERMGQKHRKHLSHSFS